MATQLPKSGWLDGYDKRLVKKEADYIVTSLWAEFAMMRTAYIIAAGNGKGLLIFTGYQGEFSTDEAS
jgi:hypothetical protein